MASKTFAADRIQLGGATKSELFDVVVDPRAGAGVAAQLGTIAPFQGPPVALYVKTGAADTAWTPISALFVQAFSFVAAGGETDFTVTLPVARATDQYVVVALPGGVASIMGLDCPDLVPGDRITTGFRCITTAALTAGDRIDFLVTERT